jgi:hypothetical protein
MVRKTRLIEAVEKHAIVQFDNGMLGYVIERSPAKGVIYVQTENGGVRVPLGTTVEVLVTPDDLAAAYLRRPALRPVVDGAIKEMRREAFRVLDDIFPT